MLNGMRKFIIASQHLVQRHKHHRPQFIQLGTVSFNGDPEPIGYFLLLGLAIQFHAKGFQSIFQLFAARIHRA